MIRLQRIGRKKNPSYRFVLAEKSRDTQGRATEILGAYNPILKEKTITLKRDRIEYWISKGAQTSATVHNLLVKEGVVTGDKKKSVAISKKRQAKMTDKSAAKKAEAEEKAKKTKEAAEAAKLAEEKKEEASVEAPAAPEAKEKPAEEAAPEESPSAKAPASTETTEDKQDKKEA